MSRTRIIALLACSTTVIAVVLHVCQAIVLHNRIPGNLADARLANCILEHLYQWAHGKVSLLSPSQFFPTTHTLLYSDNHFGTGMVYGLFRVFGASRERAFQLWFVTLSALNAVACLYLLRRQQVTYAIACPLTFVATASGAFAYKMSHPQVLPLFPFIFALSFFLQFLASGDARQFSAFVISMTYQNICYLYYGYLGLLFFAILFVTFTLSASSRQFWRSFVRSAREHKALLWCSGVIALFALCALYWPYARFATRVGTRPFAELVTLAPEPAAWVRASPFTTLYKQPFFHQPTDYPIEGTFFPGWITYTLVILAVFGGFRENRGSAIRIVGVLAAATLIVAVAITTWPHLGNSYLVLAKLLPPIRAFRSFGRIAFLLLVVQAAAGAVLLDHVYRQLANVKLRLAVVAVAIAAALETVTLGQDSYQPKVARARAAAVLDAWRSEGFRDVLAFAPGYTNQSTDDLNLDCWSAALLVGKYCVNGYSGNEPAGYGGFLHTPSVKNAEDLLSQRGIDRDSVSLVTDWPEAWKKRLGLQVYRFSPGIVPVSSTTRLQLHVLQEVTIPVTLQSTLPDDLPCDRVGVFASYRLFQQNGLPYDNPPSLRTLVGTVPGKGTLQIMLRIQGAAVPGIYEARLSMVHEGVSWWADAGAAGSTITVVVD